MTLLELIHSSKAVIGQSLIECTSALFASEHHTQVSRDKVLNLFIFRIIHIGAFI